MKLKSLFSITFTVTSLAVILLTGCRGLWFTHAWRKCLKNTAIFLKNNGYSIVDNSEKFFWKNQQ